MNNSALSARAAFTAGVLSLSLLASSISQAQSAISNTSTYLRGINVMDLSSAGGVLPGVYGKNYTRPSLESIKALKARGIQLIRLTFSWERLQPTLNGPLNSAYLGLIMGVLTDSNSVGMKVLLDMHNFAHYMRADTGTYLPLGIPGAATGANLADVWKKLSAAVRANAAAYNAVYAYDIMNEPYYEPGIVPSSMNMTDMKVWEVIAQQTVTGIRSLGDNKLIHVGGIMFSNSREFPRIHPEPFIKDPANNIMYHAHMYPDTAQSGGFALSFAEEEATAKQRGDGSVPGRMIKRVKAFANWCKLYKQQCFLGEVGWPNADTKGASEAALWNQAGEDFFQYMDSINMGATMWMTGSWQSPTDNVNNVYVLPRSGVAFRALSQAPILEAHLGKSVNLSSTNLACVTTQSNTDFVRNLYRLLMGRDVDSAGLSSWVGALNNKSMNRDQVLKAIYYSGEYQTRLARQLIHPAGSTGVLSDVNFVRCAYATLLLRGSDSAGEAHFIDKMNQGVSRGDLLQFFTGSPEFQSKIK